MKRIPSHFVRLLVIFLIGSGTLAVQLRAQNDHSITASIPFPFTAGTQTMAPGIYRFEQTGPYAVSILNVKTGVKQIFPVHPGSPRTLAQHERVIFRILAKRSFLSEVDFSGTEMLVNFSRSALREEMKATQPLPSNSVSVAQR
jgi:hypothetical protein